MGGEMIVYRDSNGNILNVGEWDLCPTPMLRGETPLEPEEHVLLAEKGLDNRFVYDKDYNLVYADMNPIPEGTTFADEECSEREDGALWPVSDWRAFRVAAYPSIYEQLDMQYWDAINKSEKWKETIAEIKRRYPKNE